MPLRVFVVDDERIIADTLAAILKLSGYEATAFYDGESALSACAISCPECVISDVMMPGINGVDMAIRIRHDFPECKVLLFSGQAGTGDILEAAGAEGREFEVLQKPVHPKDLLARLGMFDLKPPCPEVESSPSNEAATGPAPSQLPFPPRGKQKKAAQGQQEPPGI